MLYWTNYQVKQVLALHFRGYGNANIWHFIQFLNLQSTPKLFESDF